jgi:hypothetical protein
MGMISSLDHLTRTAKKLEETYDEWWKTRSGAKRKKLERRIEYLLKEVSTWKGFAMTEWREAFPEGMVKPSWD